MQDMFDAIYALLVLSVPFMLGIAVGREFRKTPTQEHKIGAELLGIADSVHFGMMVSGQCIVRHTATIRIPNKPDLKLLVTAKEAP